VGKLKRALPQSRVTFPRRVFAPQAATIRESGLTVRQEISHGPPASSIWPLHFPSILRMSEVGSPVTPETPSRSGAPSRTGVARPIILGAVIA
jgi:hypothetical protein